MGVCLVVVCRAEDFHNGWRSTTAARQPLRDSQSIKPVKRPWRVVQARVGGLLLGFGEVAASVAARVTAGPWDPMLLFDLGAVAALVVVVVDAAVVRAVLLRRRVERRHVGHGVSTVLRTLGTRSGGANVPSHPLLSARQTLARRPGAGVVTWHDNFAQDLAVGTPDRDYDRVRHSPLT